MPDTIDFFFEFASPYSYIAAQTLPAIAQRTGRTLRWRPVNLGQVWAGLGIGEANAAIRAVKRPYIARDAARIAADRNIPFSRPASFPPDATLARLAVHGLALHSQQSAGAFACALWHRFWGQGQPINTAEDLAAAMPASVTSEQLLAATADPRSRTALEAATAEAIELQCFGVPWITADGQSYFGQDRLDLMERQLTTKQAA